MSTVKCQSVEMVYSHYKKMRISLQGHRSPTIVKILKEEGMSASRRGITMFLKKYRDEATIARRPGSARPSKITEEIKKVVEEQMKADDETTAYQLHALLTSKGFALSRRTILRCRTSLGWTFHGCSYCQGMLISRRG